MRACVGFLVVILSAGQALAVDPQAAGYRELERVAAVVNEDVVLLSEIEEQLVPALQQLPVTLKGPERTKRVEELRKEVLDGLIADKLLQQQVDALHVEVTSDEVERAIKEVMQQNGLEEGALRQALAQQGMSMAQYRDTLRKQLLKAKIINIKVRNRVNLTEQDIQSAVARRARTQKREYKVRAQHALFLVAADATKDVEEAQRVRAETLLARAKAGAEFGALAKELSDPPTQNGGDLGFIRRGDMAVPAFEAAVFGTTPGQTVGPVRTPLGWHVIRVLERRTLDNRNPEQVEKDLRDQLMAEELERAFKRYISELRNNAHVEVRI